MQSVKFNAIWGHTFVAATSQLQLACKQISGKACYASVRQIIVLASCEPNCRLELGLPFDQA